MHCMLVVLLENETKTEEAKTVLLRLDRDGSIDVYGYAVIAKNADGTVDASQADAYGTFSPSAGILLESLRGTTATAFGAAPQVSAASSAAKTREDFINEAKEVLLPRRVAIVAEVEEEWPPVVDSRMEPIGGIVFRWTMSEAQHATEM